MDVVFYRPGTEIGNRVSDTVSDRVSDSVSDTAAASSNHKDRVMAYLATKTSITSKEVEALIGVKEARARRILKEMTDKGLLEKRGSARSTYYVKATP